MKLLKYLYYFKRAYSRFILSVGSFNFGIKITFHRHTQTFRCRTSYTNYEKLISAILEQKPVFNLNYNQSFTLHFLMLLWKDLMSLGGCIWL